MYKKILVPMDGSDPSRRALLEALSLAGLTHGTVRVIYVVDEPALFAMSGYFDPTAVRQAIEDDANTVTAAARETMRTSGVTGDTQIIESDNIGEDVATSIETAATAYGADLVVMGTHGRRGVRRMVIGSVAERFLRVSTCPVLLIRADDANS
ncbi:universal stress protein [Pararobbsia silviterrae]|uniref:Universal stress protein n=1 Tax=Pararobbsia silviterrae TaxID=1792498 RepID=A0A494XAW0_9BURK|nr:universal stress protein [Pararobbsia silviterrae]RKP47698.1 universal stress protein [Pararobbsia silviterrae]